MDLNLFRTRDLEIPNRYFETDFFMYVAALKLTSLSRHLFRIVNPAKDLLRVIRSMVDSAIP